jgi:hypothetical protein
MYRPVKLAFASLWVLAAVVTGPTASRSTRDRRFFVENMKIETLDRQVAAPICSAKWRGDRRARSSMLGSWGWMFTS